MLPQPAHDEWSTIYGTYGNEISGFVRTRVPAPEVDDVLQDIWSSLAHHLAHRPIHHPRAWLYRVARNRITDLYRMQANQPDFLELPPTLPDPQDPPSDLGAVTEQLRAALAELPPDQREVYERNELGGETLREIANDLGIPLKTAISRKGYARRRLRNLLREVYETYFAID
jgi:RNA polymerase sigma factor (sigma-70 family)